MLDSEQAMTTFLVLHRHRARDCARAGDDRQLQVVGHRGRAQVRPGQERRQLDQPQGRRSRLPAQGAHRPALRRRRRRHGVRRGRSGRHHRAQGLDLPAGLPDADRAGGLRSDRHHLRSQHPGDRDRSRRAQRLRHQLHRGHAHHQGDLPGREDQRRRQQPVVLVPWQRSRARGDPFGVSVSCHQGRHGHGDRQRRPADRLRGHPEGSARARRGHHLQPAAGRDRADGAVRRAGQGHRGDEEGSGRRVAAGHRRVAAVARARPRRRRLHRCRRRRGAAAVRAAARDHRGAADGRHEDRRRPVRRRQDVPAAGRQERAGDEARRRLPAAVHGGREAADR